MRCMLFLFADKNDDPQPPVTVIIGASAGILGLLLVIMVSIGTGLVLKNRQPNAGTGNVV